MEIVINLNSEKRFKDQDHYGNKMSLDNFIKDCNMGMLTDYDGIVGEILLNDIIVNDDMLSPSYILDNKRLLCEVQEKMGNLDIVWYNK